ncbi:MAG: DUF4214 domain-containing protein [Methylococcales bacterium]
MMYRNIKIGLFVVACTSSMVNASEALLDTGVERASDSVVFNFENLAEHAEIILNFDLFLLGSWDGNNEAFGTDVFGFKIDGVEQSWTFRNFSRSPGDESNIDGTWNTGNFDSVNKWGEIDRHFINYADGFTIDHSGSNLNLEFFGSGLQKITDESWRVEKISLKTVSLLPEEDQAAFIERLYLGALNREVGPDELDSSLNVMQTNSGAKVAFDLLQSQEFVILQLSDSDFIYTLYETLFDRSPDQDELNAWTQELEFGKLREMVVYDFLRNQEFDYLVSSFDVVAFSEDDNAIFQMKSFVQRFYKLVLDREPDIGGFNYWTSQLIDDGEAGGDIAKRFFQSAEFINRQTADSEFLEIVYRSFFDREADSEGKQYWLDELSFGASRSDIINGFIRSQEYLDLTSIFGVAVSSDGDNSFSQIKSFIRRFYQLVLDREPDVGGFNYWLSRLDDGTETGGDFARGLFESSKFINRQTTDSEFLDVAYRSFFNREASSEGKQYWMDELSFGAGRLSIVDRFIGSQEFINLANNFGIRAD